MTGNYDSSRDDIVGPDLTWVEGTHYLRFTNLSATAGNIGFDLANSGDRGGFGAIQLVAIPEPGTLALLGIVLGTLLLFRRRR